MATTTIHHPIKKLSSKAAEIYREDCGRICYLCFHCGFDSDNITDTLEHIEIHFRSQNSVPPDEHSEFVEIKCEPFDDSQSVTNPDQLEQIFVDCGTKRILDKEKCEEMDDTYGDVDVVTPEHQLDDNSTHLECLFEWKCIYCHGYFKKSTKLLQHLTQKHKSVPELTLIDGTKKIKAHFTLKCMLCSLEFFDTHSSEQHLKACHPAPPPRKCFVCCRKFKSSASMKDHMSTVHGGEPENEDAVKVEPTETVERKKVEKPDKHSVCTLCDRTFTGRLEFMQHIFGHFSLKMFSCAKCPTHFQRLSTYNAHMKKVHHQSMAPKLICRFCNDSVDHKTFHDFLTHAFTQHLDDGDRKNSVMDTCFEYQCRFCFQQFNEWTHASTHLNDHVHDDLPSELPSAAISNGRSFTERARSQAYRSELLYNCLSCASTLCGSFEARNHQITEHKPTTKPVPVLSSPVRYRLINLPIKSEKKDFQCFDCDKSFETKVHLMRHRLSHFNIQPYECTECPRTFGSNANATRHISKEHKTSTDQLGYRYRTLICSFCKAEFTDDSYFIEHTFKEHLYENFNIDENLDELCKYECIHCSEIILGRNCLDQHLRTHTNDVLFELPGANAGDKESEESSINQLRHKRDFMYVCLHCPLKFRLPFVARSHSMTHKTESQEMNLAGVGTETVSDTKKDTHCHTCNITFLTWRSMINHSAKVHPETIARGPSYKKRVGLQATTKSKKSRRRAPEGNQCNICNMTFLSNRSMINHRTKRHPESVESPQSHPMHTCSICDKSFRERCNFNKHVETHTKVRSYSCDMCNKTYRLKNSLDTHMLIHTNEKNFVCEECGKSFYTTSKLNLHKQVHENLTLQCDKCEKVFYTRNNFSKHQKTHTDNVRKKCKICGNTFKSAVSLRVHMFLHDDKKKYSCRYCDMTFAQSSGRRGHERSRHGFV